MSITFVYMNVNTLVYKDSGNIYPNGCNTSVDASSVIIGMETVKLDEYPLEQCVADQRPQVDFLKIIDPIRGLLYIGETEQSWSDKISTIAGSSSTDMKDKTYILGDPDMPAAGANIIISELKNAHVSDIQIDDVPVSTSLFNPATATLGPFSPALQNGQKIKILYKFL